MKPPEEGPKDFIARLRTKARDHKEELSYIEEIYLEIADKFEEEAILGCGGGSKL